jgi:membrane protease subunit HflK
MRDPAGTVKVAAESAMREVVGQRKIQNALTDGKEEIQQTTKETLQKVLDEFKSGIRITKLTLLKVDPPKQVVDAFNEVQRAKAEKERFRNEAEAYRNSILPKAKGQAVKLIQDAEAYKVQKVNDAKGESERFLSVYKEYRKAKDVTAKRLYLETMEEVLSGTNKIIIDPSSKGTNVLPYLPLEGLKTNKGGQQ